MTDNAINTMMWFMTGVTGNESMLEPIINRTLRIIMKYRAGSL